MQVPNFPECSHPLITSLFHYSDQDLLTLFQRQPESGQHFTAIFCRYSALVYSLIQHSVRSPVQAEYLFATTWRHIYHELGGLDLRAVAQNAVSDPNATTRKMTLQSWIINVTALCINRSELPPVESIHYSLHHASPPLWCYVEQALEQLEPTQRLVVLMSYTFHWSETRIAAYLQAEGEHLSIPDIKHHLAEGYQQLQQLLPDDIREIYLGDRPLRPSETEDPLDLDQDMDTLFSPPSFEQP